jgi:hypothetical protein
MWPRSRLGRGPLLNPTSTATLGKRQRSLQRQLLYATLPTILAFVIIEGLFRLCLVDEDVILRH